MKNLIVWDLETTGFVDNPEARIIEIGAVHVKDGEIVERKSWLLNHNIEIPEVITGITNITKEMIDAEGIDPELAIREFLIFLNKEEYHLTHNGYRFDIPFFVKEIRRMWSFLPEIMHLSLERELRDFGQDSAAMYKAKKLNTTQQPIEDFKDFADRVLNTKAYGVKYNVSIACDELGIDRSQINLHRALGDVELTYEIYKKLIT